MRWLFVLSAVLLLGLTPIYQTHEAKDQVDDEFTNIFLNVQPIQFEVRSSTPSNEDLQEGQMVIVSSGGFVSLHLRVGTTNYQVRFSTI